MTTADIPQCSTLSLLIELCEDFHLIVNRILHISLYVYLLKNVFLYLIHLPSGVCFWCV